MAEIAKCPKCSASIDASSPYAWCAKCGEPLPNEIQERLPALVAIRTRSVESRAITARAKKLQEIAHESTASSSPPGSQESIVVGVVEGDYLVVPFIGRINTGFFSTQNAGTVSKQLQSLINQHSQQGWEFHSTTKVGVEVAPGCLASLFGATMSYITFDQVIFRRARP